MVESADTRDLKADAALAEIISGTPQKVFEVKEKNFSHVKLY